MLKKRIITAIWGIPLLAAIIWLGEPLFIIFVALWGLLALLEFNRLAAGLKITPQVFTGVVLTLILIGIRYPGLPAIINPYFDFNLVARYSYSRCDCVPYQLAGA